MPSLSSLSLSGMNAAQTRLLASAHNIANLGTDGFHREQVVQSTEAAGGVAASMTRSPVDGSAPEADLVELLQAKNSLLANLAVFRTGDRMMGTLLDVTD